MTSTPPAQPVPRGNRNGRTIFIVVGGVAALCLILCGAGAVFLFRTVSTEMRPVQNAAIAYVDDVIAGNYSSAYERMCAKVHDKVGQAKYTEVQSAQLKIRSYKVIGTNIKTVNASTTATVSLRMVQDGTGMEYTQGIFLVQEGGQWRVCEP